MPTLDWIFSQLDDERPLMSDEQVQRLQKAMDDLESGRRKHEQDVWFRGEVGPHGEAVINCGSAMCLAGDVLINDGNWVFVEPSYPAGAMTTFDTVIRAEDLEQWYRDPGLVVEYEPDQVAAELLGLDHEDADYLFDSENYIEKLWALAWMYSAGRIELPRRIAGYLHPDHAQQTEREVVSAVRLAYTDRAETEPVW